MSEPTAIRELRTAYKAILILLMINNIAGIALNPLSFFLGLIFGLAIPGAFLAVHYTAAAMRREPLIDGIIPLIAIAYNIFIYNLLSDNLLKAETIGGTAWPIINITLNGIVLGIAVYAHYKLKSIHKHTLNN
ncbi:MAG TPA: hypothetical protein VEC12_08985 [Bacteroidia bacterium]|nr:hypothetical protein [Bacteroidia bacterium]